MDEKLKKKMIEVLNDTNFKKKFIKKFNNKVDIPILNENAEKKIFDKIYEVIIDIIETY